MVNIDKMWKKKELDFLKKNYGKIFVKEIAKKLNKSLPSVYQKAKELKLSSDLVKNKFTKEEIDFIIKNYGKITQEEIAKRLNRPYNSIHFLGFKLRNKGYNLHSTLDHSPNQIAKMSETKSVKLPFNFTLSSQELAYIVGVLVGDGYLNKLQFHITTIDFDFAKNIERKFKKWINFPCQIYKYSNKDTYNYKQGFHYELTCNSVKMVEVLNNFYVSKNQNKAIKNIEKLIQLNKEFQIKFIEGFFDSEGGIEPHGRIGITNFNLLLIKLVSKYLNYLKINHKIYKSNKCYKISIQKKSEIYKFCKIINSSIKRKQDRILKFRTLQQM